MWLRSGFLHCRYTQTEILTVVAIRGVLGKAEGLWFKLQLAIKHPLVKLPIDGLLCTFLKNFNNSYANFVNYFDPLISFFPKWLCLQVISIMRAFMLYVYVTRGGNRILAALSLYCVCVLMFICPSRPQRTDARSVETETRSTLAEKNAASAGWALACLRENDQTLLLYSMSHHFCLPLGHVRQQSAPA